MIVQISHLINVLHSLMLIQIIEIGISSGGYGVYIMYYISD